MTRQRAAIVFGLGGVLGGMIFATSVLSRYPSFPASLRLSGLPLRFLGPLGLSGSFAICQKLRWTNVSASSARLFAASVVAGLAGVCADLMPIPVGLVTALLTADPVTDKSGRTVILHPEFHQAFSMAVAVSCGTLIAAVLLWLAVGVLTNNFSRIARTAFVLCGLGLLVLTMIVRPGVFGFFGLRPPIIGESYDRLVEQAVLELHVCGYLLFGACTGYFLTGQMPSA